MENQNPKIRQVENLGPTWKKIIVESNVPDELLPLREIARNIWWVWSDQARSLFNEIDPIIWENCQHNPIVLLEETSLSRYDALKSDVAFVQRMKSVEQQLKNYIASAFSSHL